MDKDKYIEDLEFENKMLKSENEYIRKNLEIYKNREDLRDTAAESRVIRFILKVRKKLIKK